MTPDDGRDGPPRGVLVAAVIVAVAAVIGVLVFAVIRQTLDRILPAVLMTADANNDLIRQAFAAQVYSVIPKPVSANVVFHTLERALAKVYGTKRDEKATEKPSEPKPLPPATE